MRLQGIRSFPLFLGFSFGNIFPSWVMGTQNLVDLYADCFSAQRTFLWPKNCFYTYYVCFLYSWISYNGLFWYHTLKTYGIGPCASAACIWWGRSQSLRSCSLHTYTYSLSQKWGLQRNVLLGLVNRQKAGELPRLSVHPTLLSWIWLYSTLSISAFSASFFWLSKSSCW